MAPLQRFIVQRQRFERKGKLALSILSDRRKFRVFLLVSLVALCLIFSDQLIKTKRITRQLLGEVVEDLRHLSLYLGNGQCSWQPPTYDVPENITFTKTIIAGFPSGDKRLTFVQMEALTGLSARDEWDFAFLVSTYEYGYG